LMVSFSIHGLDIFGVIDIEFKLHKLHWFYKLVDYVLISYSSVLLEHFPHFLFG